MNRHRSAHLWRSLTVGATPRRGRRWTCLIGASAINAVLFLPLLLGVHPGGDGLAVDDTLMVVFLTADAQAKAPETLREMPKPPQVNPPQRPAAIIGDKVETIETGPPTETPQSVQQRLADIATSAPRHTPYECSAVSSESGDRSAPRATLALRVGVDGQVNAAEIARTSGDADADERLLRCSRGWGPFPVAIIDGRVIESWQTIDWPPPSMLKGNSRSLSAP